MRATRRQQQRWYRLFFLAAAVTLAGTACNGTATSAAGGTQTPTLVSAATARPTPSEATATATSQALPAATATPVSGIPTSPTSVATSQSAPTPVDATPDRPFGPRTKDTGCSVHDALPDGACTPGAVVPGVRAAQVCQPGYSSSVRNVPAEVSREVYRAYGIAQRTSGEYEVDHLVPLEAGGSNDIANLWPEAAAPRPGFHEKDQIENYLHTQVCAGTMSLPEAQRAIATNWLEVYQHLPQRAQATVVPTLTPAPQSPPATGVDIISIVGARPGGRATVTAQTSPDASCSISYTTPAGKRSIAQGLGAKAADANGMVSWAWNIGPATRRGSGTVVLTCNGASTTSPIQIG
jgi:hypothetical protein